MSNPLRTCDLKHVNIVVGTFSISGFGDGDALTIEPVESLGEMIHGADGHPTWSRSNVKTHTVTLNMQSTSTAYKNLMALCEAQQAEGAIEELPFLMEDEINGDFVRSRHFIFSDRPGFTKAKSVSAAEIKGFITQPTNKYGVNL